MLIKRFLRDRQERGTRTKVARSSLSHSGMSRAVFRHFTVKWLPEVQVWWHWMMFFLSFFFCVIFCGINYVSLTSAGGQQTHILCQNSSIYLPTEMKSRTCQPGSQWQKGPTIDFGGGTIFPSECGSQLRHGYSHDGCTGKSDMKLTTTMKWGTWGIDVKCSVLNVRWPRYIIDCVELSFSNPPTQQTCIQWSDDQFLFRYSYAKI